MELIRDRRQVKAVMDSIPPGFRPGQEMSYFAMDAATAGGFAFLQGELEKRDPKVREPLTSVSWERDVPVKVGGGWVDKTSTFNVDYATSGGNALGIIGGQTNAVPIMQADIGKDLYPVYNWGHILKVSYIDLKKTQGIGRSLDDLLDKGIRMTYQKALDYNAYFGVEGNAGLLNNNSLITITAPATNAQGGTSFATSTPAEIQAVFNNAMLATWAASQFAPDGMGIDFLIPPTQWGILTAPMTLAGASSILEYILKNNVAKELGMEMHVYPSRWCIGTNNGGPNGDSSIAGASSSGVDRMVCYINDEDRLYMDITVPIQRAMTQPSVEQVGYLTLYLAQFGVVKFLYTQPALYVDGI